MTDRDEAHQLSGAYALHAVDAEEAALVEAAMHESEDFCSEVIGLSDTAVALGLALPAQTPPPALRARLLDAIDSMPQLDADEAPAPVETVSDEHVAMPAGDHVVQRRRQRRRRPMVLLALATAAVVLFGGGFFVQRTIMEPQVEYSSIQAAADKVTREETIPGGGIATISWSKSEHRTAVVLNGVTAPSGKVLQLWSIHDGVATSAGLYENGQHYAVISGTPSAGESLGVTVEPDGGSPHPTAPTIIRVKLSA